jgi:hypothetical protein
MEDTSEYETVEETGYGTGYTDPISSFVNMVGFIIILVLIIILVAMMMIGKGFGWVTDAATGGAKKEKFELPKLGPQPCPEHDERCAHFPAI